VSNHAPSLQGPCDHNLGTGADPKPALLAGQLAGLWTLRGSFLPAVLPLNDIIPTLVSSARSLVQVYERDAITNYIEKCGSDPKTRAPLRSDQLTPVYLVRARAAEYRESAAAACIEAASSPGCPDPVP
jgi:hypothetical protein